MIRYIENALKIKICLVPTEMIRTTASKGCGNISKKVIHIQRGLFKSSYSLIHVGKNEFYAAYYSETE